VRSGLPVWPGHRKCRRTVCPLTQRCRPAPTCRSHHALARQIRPAHFQICPCGARALRSCFSCRGLGLCTVVRPYFTCIPPRCWDGMLCAARHEPTCTCFCAVRCFPFLHFAAHCIHREFCTRINIFALCKAWCLHRHTPSMRTDCHMIGRVRFMSQENGCKPQYQFLAFQLNGMLQHDEAHTRRI
jgi:hypothetical protein